VHGFPQMIKAENYVIKHHLASVISQSFGATENTFKTRKSLFALRSAFKLAAKSGVTVLAASGDTGSTDYKLNGADLYPFRVNSWPSSDPLVTSVGGTQLNLDDGRRHHVPGFTALAGYDLASGLGTVDAAKLVPALVAAAARR